MARKAVKKSKTRTIVLIALAAVILIAGAFVAESYISYLNMKDMYEYYKANAVFVEDLAEKIRTQAAADNIKEYTIYSSYGSSLYTMGAASVKAVYATADAEIDFFESYDECFDAATTKAIKKIFKNATIFAIKLTRDTVTNTYRIDFAESTNELQKMMLLSYISKPFENEDAASQYYGKDLNPLCYTIWHTFNDNWYYVEDVLQNTHYNYTAS